MITVAIIEDDPAFRQRLRDNIDLATDIHCVACCASIDDALAQIPASNPDVVLVDVFLNDGQLGYQAVPPLKEQLPDTEFVMLTKTGDYDQIFTSILAGANGYLLKTEPDEKILQAIRDMHAHESVMTNSIARKVMLVFRDMANRQRPPAVELTAKEIQILTLIGQGKQYKEVAMHLHNSVRTIHTHVQNIYKKLQASSRDEALRKWRTFGG